MNLSSCFHCGLPIPSKPAFWIQYQNTDFPVCCLGCQAVANSIITANLGAYYDKRDELASTVETVDDSVLAQMKLYDLPELQQEFVYTNQGISQATLLIDGLRCAACVWLIEQSLSRVNGILSVSVNYSSQRLQLTWDADVVLLSEVLLNLHSMGYQALPYEQDQAVLLKQRQKKQAWLRLWVAALSMMQVMMYATPTYLYGHWNQIEPVFLWLLHWTSMVLTLPVMLYCAWPFYQSMCRDVQSRQIGMDTPVAVAIIVAFLGSFWALLSKQMDGVYFDSISMFVFLLLGARYLERFALDKLGNASAHLSRLIPKFCHHLPDGIGSTVQEKWVGHIGIGDVVLVKAGETVPVDGTVISGKSEINEAMLTGEPTPRFVDLGNVIYAGSLNVSSAVLIQASAVGPYTCLSGIVRLLDQAEVNKPKISTMANRYASRFLSGLMLFSILIFGYWFWVVGLQNALWIWVALLVVTCPCALSLAMPTALTASSVFLAKRGLWVQNCQALETLAQVSDVVFDKTGTLTQGQFKCVKTKMFVDGVDVSTAQQYAWALEQASEHPIASAFACQGNAKFLPQVHDWQNKPGFGVQGVIDGEVWYLGKPHWVATSIHQSKIDLQWTPTGTEVVLANAKGWVACFSLQDVIKPSAKILFSPWPFPKIHTHILSGDGVQTVEFWAKKLSVENWCAAATPEHKVEYVRNLQHKQKKILMVADGVNDAPVLKQADVSVAVSGSGDVVCANADFVMQKADMGLVEVMLHHAWKTNRIMKQNFMWAILYNLIAIPLAAFGYVSPWMAALGMSLSSLCVTLNALRLLR